MFYELLGYYVFISNTYRFSIRNSSTLTYLLTYLHLLVTITEKVI